VSTALAASSGLVAFETHGLMETRHVTQRLKVAKKHSSRSLMAMLPGIRLFAK
jgi:hypothetical protein